MRKTNRIKMPEWLCKIFSWLNKHVNFLMGSLSGFATGSIVFLINYEHGFYPALAGFFKQFAFNLLMGGFNIRSCEKIARYITNKWPAITLATIVPSIQAFIILYSIHYFGRTPKPGASTFWQFGMNLIIFFIMALFYRDVIENKEYAKSFLQKTISTIKDKGIKHLPFRKNVS